MAHEAYAHRGIALDTGGEPLSLLNSPQDDCSDQGLFRQEQVGRAVVQGGPLAAT